MIYNIDFLIAAIVILLLILWYFLGQKRAEDLNNQVFLFFRCSWRPGCHCRVFQYLLYYFAGKRLWNSSRIYNNGILSVAGIASFYVPLLYSVHA